MLVVRSGHGRTCRVSRACVQCVVLKGLSVCLSSSRPPWCYSPVYATGAYLHLAIHRPETTDTIDALQKIVFRIGRFCGSTGTHHSVLEPWVRILVLLYQQYNSTGWYRMYCKAVFSCIPPSRERTLVYSWSLGKPGEDGPGRTTWTHHRMTDMLG